MKMGKFTIGKALSIIKICRKNGSVEYLTKYNSIHKFDEEMCYYRFCNDRTIESLSAFYGINEISAELDKLSTVIYPGYKRGSYSYKVKMPVFLTQDFGDEVWFYSQGDGYWYCKNLCGYWFKIKGHPKNYADFEIIASLSHKDVIDETHANTGDDGKPIDIKKVRNIIEDIKEIEESEKEDYEDSWF